MTYRSTWNNANLDYVPNPGQRRATALMTGPQRHTLLVGGARSGKTFLLVRAITVRALREDHTRHAILRYRANAARASIALDTLPKVMRICWPHIQITEHRQDGYFELQNGSQIWIGGLDDKARVEKILGQEYATMYFNECSQIPYDSILVARTRLAQRCHMMRQRAYYDLNPSGSNHWTNLEFGRHVDPISRRPLADPQNYRRAFVNPNDNAENLTPEFLASLANLPERQRRRFYEGVYVDEIDGALWTLDDLEACRVDQRFPSLDEDRCRWLAEKLGLAEIVVSVDPSGATGREEERSDEVGVVVAGRTHGGVACLLEDLSLNAPPERWAAVVADAHRRWRADRVVAESNYGGPMVRTVLRTASPNIPVRLIHASRGKHVRAEPVSVLYQPDASGVRRAMHVGRFPDLEDQLVNFSSAGYQGTRSPDRADAWIWAVTDLVVDVMGAQPVFTSYGATASVGR